MNIGNLLLIILWLGLVPYCIGKALIRKEEDSILFSCTLGNIAQMAIFFVMAIPMILLKINFYVLQRSYSITIVVVAVICLIYSLFFRKNIINLNKEKIKKYIKNVSIFQIIGVFLVIGLLFIRLRYTNMNYDDSVVVVYSTEMCSSGNMYFEYGKLAARKAFAPISAFYSMVAVNVKLHPTIVTHTVMPIILLIMAYNIYYELGKLLFKDKEKAWIFLIIVSFLNLYSFSSKGENLYMILYTWFGRSILGGIILPLIWKTSLQAYDKSENTFRDWIMMFLLSLARMFRNSGS